MNQYEQSIIIGLWRQGASSEIIACLFNCTQFEVEKVIYDYKLNLK